MTQDEFRALALSVPDAIESSHMGHPDFRIRDGKMFATLGSPDDAWGMVKLQPEEQTVVMSADPDAFVPAAGAWGRGGSTLVRLSAASAAAVRQALALAAAAAVKKPKRRPRS